jgi:hypothetical protein
MCDNEHMRPFGTSEQLARRRQRALELLQHVVSVLKRGAYAYGYAEDYWTLEVIRFLAHRLIHVSWNFLKCPNLPCHLNHH